MCSAIFLRMIVIGTISTLSPGLYAGMCAAGAPGLAAGAGDLGPVSMKPRVSFLVTRPLIPVPLVWRVSTLCSRAILRTSGEDFCRRRSSIVSGCPTAAWGISDGAGEGEAGAGRAVAPPGGEADAVSAAAAGAELVLSPAPPMTATTAFTG